MSRHGRPDDADDDWLVDTGVHRIQYPALSQSQYATPDSRPVDDDMSWSTQWYESLRPDHDRRRRAPDAAAPPAAAPPARGPDALVQPAWRPEPRANRPPARRAEVARTRLRINPIACAGHGLCAELLPELFALDEWGYPMPIVAEVPRELEAHAQRAAQACPTLAIILERRAPRRR